VQAEREEAHRQHDDHGLDQHVHEFVDRGGDGLRLVRHAFELDTDRELGADARHGLVQRFAERDDVPALFHRHAQADHLLAVEAHLVRRRVLVLALHLGEVAQAEGRVPGAQLQVFQLARGADRASDAHL